MGREVLEGCVYPKASSAHSPGKSTNGSFPVPLLPMQALGIREGKHNKIWQTRGCATLYMVVTSIYPASFFAPRLFAPYKLAAAMIKAINAYRDGVKASPTSLFLVRAISSCRGREQRLRPASRSGSQWILHRLVQLKLTGNYSSLYDV